MSSPATTSSLDPDVLAGLERERDFLLRSLDDLDAEFDAGDLDEDDHAGLADDYTRRLAEVARSITEERAAFEQLDTKLGTRQRVLTVIGIVAIAVLGGVFLAQASGFRNPSDSTTGAIRQSSSGLLAEADTLTREGLWPEAIEIYDEVLDVAPGNVEALTYRGWLTARLGDDEAALVDLSEAVAVDPTYADARVFSAIVLDNQQRFVDAAAQLEAFDANDPPDEMLMLVQQFDLRVSVTAGQINELFGPLEPGQTVDLSQVQASLDVVADAGALLSRLGDLVLALATFDAVLAQNPDQLVALVGKGQLARSPDIAELDAELAEEAMQALDDAVELATPQNEAVIRLYRADARRAQNDPDGALEDLEAVDRDALSPDLQGLFDELAALLN